MPEDRLIDPGGIGATRQRLRDRAPLVHCMTNAVTMELVADTLNAIGAAPVMTLAEDEVVEIVGAADALTINIGTPDAARLSAMRAAAKAARALGTPWVLDPVAAGATAFRRAAAGRLLALGPAILRGNASEILALADGAGRHGRGVDAADTPAPATDAARALARDHGLVVAVTGAVDMATDGERTVRLANGHPLMARVSGMGCALTALVGACCAVTEEPLAATVHALAIFGVAGEVAAERSAGPGTFRAAFLDALYGLDTQTLAARLRPA